MRKIILGLLAALLLVGNTYAQSDEGETGREVPRMVSLRSNHINARSGPGARYPIEWVYKQKGAPVEITAEFELWRKIKDWDGSESWVHKSMLTSNRTVKVTNPGENSLYANNDYKSKVIAKIEDGVIGSVVKCPANNEFCKVKFSNFEGWIPRMLVFGVYETEAVN